MMHVVLQRLAELERRFANLILLTRICAVDTKQAKVQVQRGAITSDWLPWLTQRAGADKTYWAPSLGEQVLLLSPQGDFNQGVVLPALYQQHYAAPSQGDDSFDIHFADGAQFNYNRTTHTLSVNLPDTSATQITSKTLAISGDVTITGNLKATGDISDKTRSMQADRDIYNTHKHAGVKGGHDATQTPETKQ